MGADHRRQVPRTDAVLADPRLVVASERLGRDLVKRVVAHALDAVRRGDAPAESAVDLALAALPTSATTLRPVINATGVVLHTNLGRAPMSPAAVDALTLAAGYVDVEFDTATGQRARRGRGTLTALAEAVPDAEAVNVVNNGAAALVLAATALAQGKDIVISRGELIEIGDGFRLPDLLASTGARLVEVAIDGRERERGRRREEEGEILGRGHSCNRCNRSRVHVRDRSGLRARVPSSRRGSSRRC